MCRPWMHKCWRIVKPRFVNWSTVQDWRLRLCWTSWRSGWKIASRWVQYNLNENKYDMMQLVHNWSAMNAKMKPSYDGSLLLTRHGQSLWTTTETTIKRVASSRVTAKSNISADRNQFERYTNNCLRLGWCYHKAYRFPNTYSYCGVLLYIFWKIICKQL